MSALTRRGQAPARAIPTIAEIEQEFEALTAFGGQRVASCEPDYPRLLSTLPAPPPLLAIRGDPALATRRTIGIVGARDASAAGLRIAEIMAAELSALGFVVVSGLARGIDAKAHAASLAGGTIAALAGGIDQPYPPQNESLYQAICSKGLVVTDAPFGLAPRARDFPRRNAVIAGLCEAVVVVEASARSGSLMTAHAAIDMGRDVMAVPGSPLEPRARGANALIKEGAALVESAEDVAAALGTPRIPKTAPVITHEPEAPDDSFVAQVARALSPTPLHLNDLARALGASAAAVAAALTELELSGQAESGPGGFASRPDG